jgi:hypothetical protein
LAIHYSPLPSDAYGGVLEQDLTPELETALAGQVALADPATGLVHLGNGRWYDPALGRPLQPNPAGGPPTVPQALNRYAATSMGPPGVAEAVATSGIDLTSPTAWIGLVANVGLGVAGQNVVAQSGRLVLQGSASALEKTLVGKGVPFDVVSEITIGGPLGSFAIGLNRILVEKLLIFEVATQGEVGVIKKLGSNRFLFNKFATEIDASGLSVTAYRRGFLLGESKALSAILGAGLTGVVDAGYELYGFATGSGRWGNPYWQPWQKNTQAGLVVGSDIALAIGLALAPVDWPIAAIIAFGWAVSAESIFTEFPLTAPAYYEHRNLQPLE